MASYPASLLIIIDLLGQPQALIRTVRVPAKRRHTILIITRVLAILEIHIMLLEADSALTSPSAGHTKTTG